MERTCGKKSNPVSAPGRSTLTCARLITKKYNATTTHLDPGLLAYRVVNTVRYQLKKTENEADEKQETDKSETDTTPINFLRKEIIRIHVEIGFDGFSKSLRSSHH